MGYFSIQCCLGIGWWVGQNTPGFLLFEIAPSLAHKSPTWEPTRSTGSESEKNHHRQPFTLYLSNAPFEDKLSFNVWSSGHLQLVPRYRILFGHDIRRESSTLPSTRTSTGECTVKLKSYVVPHLHHSLAWLIWNLANESKGETWILFFRTGHPAGRSEFIIRFPLYIPHQGSRLLWAWNGITVNGSFLSLSLPSVETKNGPFVHLRVAELGSITRMTKYDEMDRESFLQLQIDLAERRFIVKKLEANGNVNCWTWPLKALGLGRPLTNYWTLVI